MPTKSYRQLKILGRSRVFSKLFLHVLLNHVTMDGTQICREIADLHDSIVGTEIVEKGVTIAAHVKSGTLTKLEKLFIQTEFYMNVLSTNAEHLGRPHYLLAHNDSTDLFFFPIVVNGRKMILVVRASVPYNHEEIINKMREYIGRLRLGYH